MASAATKVHCPECGAPLKTGDALCWMCYRQLAWNDGVVATAAAATPFQDRATGAPRVRYKTNVAAIIGIVLAALAMFPAAIVACLVTCAAVAGNRMENMDTAVFTSLGAGVIVLVGFCVLIGILGMRSTRVIRT